MREPAHGAERYFVLDGIGDEGGVHSVPTGGREGVAVLPGGAGTADLFVAEVMVPGKLGDLGLPANAQGGERKGAETEREPRADSGCNGGRASGAGLARRREDGDVLDARALPPGHKQRKIVRVCKEIEDPLDGMRQPALSVIRKKHDDLLMRFN